MQAKPANETQETKVEASPASTKARKEAVHQIVMEWMNEHCRNSPVSQSTEAWNHLNGVLKHLVDRLV